MHHFREVDVQLLLEDVASILAKKPTLTLPQLVGGLRRSFATCPNWADSGRKWKLRGGGWMVIELREILEAHGYTMQRDGRAERIVKAA